MKWQWQFELSASSRSLSFSSDGGSKSTTITSRRRMIYINDSGSATGSLGNWESHSFSSSESLSWITKSTSGNTIELTAEKSVEPARSGTLTVIQNRSGYYLYGGSDYPSDSSSISVTLSQSSGQTTVYIIMSAEENNGKTCSYAYARGVGPSGVDTDVTVTGHVTFFEHTSVNVIWEGDVTATIHEGEWKSDYTHEESGLCSVEFDITSISPSSGPKGYVYVKG